MKWAVLLITVFMLSSCCSKQSERMESEDRDLGAITVGDDWPEMYSGPEYRVWQSLSHTKYRAWIPSSGETYWTVNNKTGKVVSIWSL